MTPVKLWKVREVPGLAAVGPDGKHIGIGDSIEMNLKPAVVAGFCERCGFSTEPPTTKAEKASTKTTRGRGTKE